MSVDKTGTWEGPIADYLNINKDAYNGGIRHHERGNASEEHFAARKRKGRLGGRPQLIRNIGLQRLF
jgi:hypothetical protein